MIDDDGSEYSNNSGSAGSNDSSASDSSMDIEDDEVTKTLSKAIAIDKTKIDDDLLERITKKGDRVIKGKHGSEETTLLLAMATSSIKNPTTKAGTKKAFFAPSKLPPADDIEDNGYKYGRIIECKKDNVVYVRADGSLAMVQYFKDEGFTAGIVKNNFIVANMNTTHTLSVSFADDSQEYTEEDMGWTEAGKKWADTWPYKNDAGYSSNSYGGFRSSAKNADETTGEKKTCFFLWGLNASKDGKEDNDKTPIMKYTRGHTSTNKTSIMNKPADGGLGTRMIRNGEEKRVGMNEYAGLLEIKRGEPIGFIEEVTQSKYDAMKDKLCGTADAPSKRYKTEILPHLPINRGGPGRAKK